MFWIALLLGVVEGLTEFLPISSTGHLIVASSLLGFGGRRAEVFEIFIQVGAIAAVVWEFRARLKRVALEFPVSAGARAFVGRIALAFVPLASIGFLFHDWLIAHLFRPAVVAWALIAGALLIFLVEALRLQARVHEVEQMTWTQAACIGLAQCLALWPGFSRSAATILGGLVVGMDRRTAAEFSFFLAVPTLGGAAAYQLLKAGDALNPGDGLWLGLAQAVSFIVAWGTIRWLLRFVSTHSFRVFAWYRLVLGLAILLLLGR
jgi:undecaprenyl-diphosphatase